ncbi:TPA: NAD(P)-dependent oxidoreductase [Campylobacter jejuni]|nr:NAD(P)H-binding protein [Campylobacter jejuni]EJJ4821843.1 NAD(P)-dependent oxidoreductase [Campylobacter jejuni]EJQ9503049.1 NAD(P)-dependent oxidoreductase [Campylobacter jejuni]HDV7412399.1 NAD(P)-dependent oxidoreductase [Campylobacter jejuni]HDV7432635.1 NAD(P)-dependent oxidoreductase [Campylobacter jejuni]
MKIAILCASGKVGKEISKEALRRNLEPVCFVRNSSKMNEFLPQAKIVQKDLFELDFKDLVDFDIIIDAFGEWENLSLHKKHIECLSKILQGSKAKLFVVGGAGSLYMDENHTTRLMDMPDFPKEYLDIAKASAEVLEFLRNEKGFKWVYVSPSAIFSPDLPKTNHYKIIGEKFEVNANNESKISYSDYASAMIDIVLNSCYENTRIGVISL